MKTTGVEQILPWRDFYRQEMNCQVIHDSIHDRAGWTVEYSFHCNGSPAGYGSVAVAGPWKDKPTIYELYLLPSCRAHLFECFSALREISRATAIETQSNDVQLTILLHAFATNVRSESILFHDDELTSLIPPGGATFRRCTPEDSVQVIEQDLDTDAQWLVEVGGRVAAAGDILFHYNRPYGDIYMKVAEGFRRRGLGSYLVQALKRVCYGGGSVPAARCNPNNVAIRKTLQKAGFVACGHILTGSLEK